MLAALVFAHTIRERLEPILTGMVNGLAEQARRNAQAYAIAMMFGLSASLSAFVDVFKDMNAAAFDGMSMHQYLAAVAKVANPFLVAVLAYATQNKFAGKEP